MFSSKKDDWTTPQSFYDQLNREFHFDMDSAADDENHKCDRYLTKEIDGLTAEWGAYLVQPSLRAQNRRLGQKGL